MKNNLHFPAKANSIWVCLIFLLPLAATAQQKDSLKFNNRKYKYEVGIDMQGVFSNGPGTGLVFKIRNDRGKYVPVSYGTNYRFQLILNGQLNSEPTVETGDTLYTPYYDFNKGDQALIQILAGWERVQYFNRFNFYYGMDAGPFYRHMESDYFYVTYLHTDGNYYSTYTSAWETDHTSYGVSVVPFVGVKYRLTDRFSVSVETSLWLEYSTTIVRLNPNEPVWPELYNVRSQYHSFGSRFSYLRLCSFNYHFG
ncbi:MAG: hypothetical protein IT270_10555 [Saprospiraceae bacterium]|nr:hypothetical protein [Saprospiraceae bacterium]